YTRSLDRYRMAGILCVRRLPAAGLFTLLLTPALTFAQYPVAPWRRAQGLTSRTQNDFLRASHFVPSVSAHEVERYNNAIRHLSDSIAISQGVTSIRESSTSALAMCRT